MGKSLDIRYIDYLKQTKNHIDDLQSNPIAFKDLLKHSFFQTKEGRIFHFKKPHSRDFKLKADNANNKKSSIKDEIVIKDNQIATANELLLQHTYRKFVIKTAEHRTTDLQTTALGPENLGVISENYLGEDLEYTTLYNFFCMNNEVAVYKNHINKTYNYMYWKNVETLEINSQILNIFGGINSFEHLLDFKNEYLQLMTPEVYDKIIKNYIISVFDFSNDDHLTNGYLVKKKNQDYFEDFYIFDKESTSFTLPIATGCNYNTTKKKTLAFNNYNSNIHLAHINENFESRKNEILRLAIKGKLEPKYCELLRTIANIDYSGLAGRIKQKYNIEANPIQIDMLKFGSEQAGEIYNMI